ncbi:CMP-N,N'-diacetyllegionaminic acid synthase [Fundidesulfovibrio magnetotacticus]|uniref:CMP-N,N'-diacetyllegionaminic acid synthase n=1 Tax=Fundidesulfovibrio magnetotacticus TaxID=2730080 RepID=A0A6V8M324_9BACT|nr:acylneuraminate cytidylyltransferase family protein [Fundidesulfovibrio magnetotacticus]GFK94845.1 CMP-N,N'-diacetyllegionaminic acid synthase [Fundidesulfovibrio magnetotacticus]
MSCSATAIAVIPARGGSKSIPRKNLADLGGRPLIAWAIRAGLDCPDVQRVIVSTDDPEIADAAREHGAEVPFLRPAELAQDDTPDAPVFVHLLQWLEENEGFRPDALVNLRCTTPLKRPEHVSAVLKLLFESGCDSVRTVDRIQGKHHPYWMFKQDEQGYAATFVDGIDLKRFHRRQLLPPAWSINALVDAMTASAVLGPKPPYGERMRLLETDPLYSIDIDAPKDLLVCRALLEALHELV